MAQKIGTDDLTLDEMVEIEKEAILGLSPSLTTPAALAFREVVERDVRAIIARGRIPELPPTW